MPAASQRLPASGRVGVLVALAVAVDVGVGVGGTVAPTHCPVNPTSQQYSPSPVQARSQQRPSRQNPDAHCPGRAQIAPKGPGVGGAVAVKVAVGEDVAVAVTVRVGDGCDGSRSSQPMSGAAVASPSPSSGRGSPSADSRDKLESLTERRICDPARSGPDGAF